MFEGDRKLTWHSFPSFTIFPNSTTRLLAFLRIYRSSPYFCGVGDSAVGSPKTSVWDLSVGTSSFVMGDSAVGTTSIVLGASAVGTPSFVIDDSEVDTTSSAVGDSAVVIPYFLQQFVPI